jgi:hypothetical protein
MFSENEICDAREAFFSLEDDKPTLWDSDGPGRTRVVVLTTDDGRVCIVSDPETVTEYLDA